MEFFQWLEQTPVSVWVRESPSVLAYPSVLLLHTIGLSLCVGVAAGIDLRIVGLAPALRLAPLDRFFPVLWAGFWINAATGVLLLMQDASTKMTNPVFYVKLVLVALAVINLRMVRARVIRDPRVDEQPISRHAKVLAATSLVLWFGAVTAGRLLAYFGPTSGFD